MSGKQSVEFGMGMISCAQLGKENVDVLDDSVAAEFKVVTDVVSAKDSTDSPLRDQLAVGMEGICITGTKGECPKGHNCGAVKIISTVLPLFVEIEPLIVRDIRI